MSEQLYTKQFSITVPAGKRLIAKAVASLKPITDALRDGTIVVVSGTTNAYVAEELLALANQTGYFDRHTFFRGITTAPGAKLNVDADAPKDIVLEQGKWVKDKTIFDAAPTLGPGDIILKGANAVDCERKVAGIQIGNPTLGTSGALLPAVIGRRVQLIIPVGLEKRVCGDINVIAEKLSAPSADGPRLLPVSGTIVTELEAIGQLTGTHAELVAAGGVLGAEGGCYIAVTGTEAQLQAASELIRSVAREPAFGV